MMIAMLYVVKNIIKAIFTLKFADCSVNTSRFNDFDSYKEAYK